MKFDGPSAVALGAQEGSMKKIESSGGAGGWGGQKLFHGINKDMSPFFEV